MHVVIDGETIAVPAATTLAEVLGGVGPYVDPTRLVTRLTVNTVDVDPTDDPLLAGWRLVGSETISIGTEGMPEFAQQRRAESAKHLGRIADWLELAAKGLRTGETQDANTVLAAATRELALILELDAQLVQLDHHAASFPSVVAAVERVGDQLTAAERGQRWDEVASLLDADLVPALRLDAA